MAEKMSCSCSTDTKTVLACSGASNVGQITNEVAKALDTSDEASFFCLAGIGGHVSGMIESVKGSDKVVVLDGCPVGCAKKTMDEAGITGYEYLVVTDLGIVKKHNFDLATADMEKAVAAVRAMLGQSSACCG